MTQKILIVGAATALALQVSQKLKEGGFDVEVIDEKSIPQEKDRSLSVLKDIASGSRSVQGMPNETLSDAMKRSRTVEVTMALNRIQESEKAAIKPPFFVHDQGKQKAQWKSERSRKRGVR